MSQTKELLFAFITNRYKAQETRKLGDYIFSNELFHIFEDEFADFLFHSRKEIFQYLSTPDNSVELIEYCIRSTKEYTYKRNQFINFTKQYDELLLAEYQSLLEQIKALTGEANSREELTQRLAVSLQRHHERLRLIFSSYCVISTQRDLKNNPLLQSVPCEEYSARFQLDVLNLDFKELIEPVLDIGCGADGTLVRFLSLQGLDVRGIDRLAPKGDSFEQIDWFDFDLEQQKWGTVIAHQSLSTHFIYNYLSNTAMLEEYAKLFMRILASLKTDGRLCYAPGMPFFEETIAKLGKYKIHRKTLAADFLGIGEIAYSVQLQKIYK